MFIIVPIEKLIVTDNPAPEQDITELKESIRKSGLHYPLLVTENNGFYHVVDGRTRYRALKQLGWTSVPCIKINTHMQGVAKYEVEICRRHLSWEELQKLRKEEVKELRDATTRLLKEVSFMMSDAEIKKYEEKIQTDPFSVYTELIQIESSLPLFDRIKSAALEQTELYREKELLAKKCTELESKLHTVTAQFDEVSRKYRMAIENSEKLKEEFRRRVDQLVQDELRRINRESVKDIGRLKARIEKEVRERVTEEMMQEVEESRKEVIRLSREYDKLKHEKEKAEEEIERSKRTIDDLSKYIEKIKDEAKHRENILKKALNTSMVLKRMQKAKESIVDIHQEFTSLIDYINLLPESGITVEKEHLLAVLDSTEDDINKLKNILHELRKTVKKLG